MRLWLKIILVILVIAILLVILSFAGVLDNSLFSGADTGARTVSGGINDATDAIRDAVN